MFMLVCCARVRILCGPSLNVLYRVEITMHQADFMMAYYITTTLMACFIYARHRTQMSRRIHNGIIFPTVFLRNVSCLKVGMLSETGIGIGGLLPRRSSV